MMIDTPLDLNYTLLPRSGGEGRKTTRHLDDQTLGKKTLALGMLSFYQISRRQVIPGVGVVANKVRG
jgi:hypothetical protein